MLDYLDWLSQAKPILLIKVIIIIPVNLKFADVSRLPLHPKREGCSAHFGIFRICKALQ